MIPLSIVICTRNRSRHLMRLLESIRRLEMPADVQWDVVVVDNASTDDTRDVVNGYRDVLPLVLVEEAQVGLSCARNAALDRVAERHTVWTDDDVTVPAQWLSVYERAFRYWPQCDFFGAPVVASFQGEAPGWVDDVLSIHPEMLGHIDPVREFVDLGADSEFLPFGANMAFRAGLLRNRRFNQNYGRRDGVIVVGAEEIELLRRIAAGGGRGIWLPPAAVRHWIGPDRQTIRHLYDFAFGEAFHAELVDAGAPLDRLLDRVDPAAIDRAFNDLASCPGAGGTDAAAWLHDLNSTAAADGRALAGSMWPGHFRTRPRRSPRRVLAIGLDGFDGVLADRMIDQGQLPNLQAFREGSARYALDHGQALYTGLAWEQFSIGRAPQDYRRYAAVHFDVEHYRATQEPTRHAPFTADLDEHTVVFDVPYFDLHRMRHGSGVTNWGAHDPGVARQSRPLTLSEEVRRRFGPYPASQWIYGFTWPDPAQTAAMGEALVEAVEQRTQICRWLLDERLSNWDLALIAAGELHSSIEPFWHGVDGSHPLHHAPSAPIARHWLEAIHRATDRLVGELCRLAPDADTVVFSMHGMGANHADLPAMLLLPELMFRHAFGVVAWNRDPQWTIDDAGMVLLRPGEAWSAVVTPRVRIPAHCRAECFKREAGRPGNGLNELAWMPAAAYRPSWPLMDAFAVPSFYDGRIRVNLKGREGRGRVTTDRYNACCESIIELIDSCRDIRTGKRVVDGIDRYRGDPLELDPSDADIRIRWRAGITGFNHPRLGSIGPAPYRRTGGHGGPGVAWIKAADVPPGDHGVASAFDVVPTLLARLGIHDCAGFSGEPLPLRDMPRAAGRH